MSKKRLFRFFIFFALVFFFFFAFQRSRIIFGRNVRPSVSIFWFSHVVILYIFLQFDGLTPGDFYYIALDNVHSKRCQLFCVPHIFSLCLSFFRIWLLLLLLLFSSFLLNIRREQWPNLSKDDQLVSNKHCNSTKSFY